MISIRDKKHLEKFGKHIRMLRLSKGLSQVQLEFESEISKNQIGNIERGEINPTISTLKRIAKALGVQPKDLLDF